MATTTATIFPLASDLTAALRTQLIEARPNEALALLQANQPLVQSACADLITALLAHLTDDNYANAAPLYATAQRLLEHIAQHAPPLDCLFALLEALDATTSDNVFCTLLKALQINLLQHDDPPTQARSFEWAFNGALDFVQRLPLPERIRDNTAGHPAERLFEENDAVRRLVSTHLLLDLFYQPLADGILAAEKSLAAEPHLLHWRHAQRSEGLTPRNVAASFLLQQLSHQLALLDLERPSQATKATNTYSWQCAQQICAQLLRLLPDPLVLLASVRRRELWHPRAAVAAPVAPGNLRDSADSGLAAPDEPNVFLCEERAPLAGIGVFFYLLYVEELLPASAPRVYSPLYVLEGVLPLLAAMLSTNTHALHSKALRLADWLLRRLFDPAAADGGAIPRESLDQRCHEQFAVQLCRVATQSPCRQNSQHAAKVLRTYVMRFDGEGRFYVLRNVLATQQHDGLLAHAAAMYKDVVAEAMRQTKGDGQLPAEVCGWPLRRMVGGYICRLTDGAKTDLLESSNRLVTALNVLYYLAMAERRSDNRLGLWQWWPEVVEVGFLGPLREGLSVSRAHYALERQKVERGEGTAAAETEVEVSVLNGDGGEEEGPLSRTNQMRLLRAAETQFDVMESLVGSIDKVVRGRKPELELRG